MRFLNENFLHFSLGFALILMMSFSVTIAIDYYDKKNREAGEQVAIGLEAKN